MLIWLKHSISWLRELLTNELHFLFLTDDRFQSLQKFVVVVPDVAAAVMSFCTVSTRQCAYLALHGQALTKKA